LIFIRGRLNDAEIEEESGMSKQAAPKLVHGALNVVWEELKICDFLGVDTQASPSPLGSSKTKIKWVDQPQASNPFEIIHIRDTNSESFPTRWSQNRIGQAHFSLLTECDCLVDGFITDGNGYEMSLRTSEAWSCHDPLHATKTHLSNLS
jgi:hypothetical protein